MEFVEEKYIVDSNAIPKRIFVTGATGMLGSYVVSELLKAGGYEIWFSYRSEKSLEKLRKRLEYDSVADKYDTLIGYNVDLDIKQEMTTIFSKVDVVVNCAANVDLGRVDKARLIRDNIELASAVVSATKEAGVFKFIHISSIATLGSCSEGEDSIDENCLPVSLSGYNAYSISKFYAEAEVWKAINNGMNALILNPAVIIGSGDWANGSPSIFRRISNGLKFYPCGATGYVGAQDVARAVLCGINSDISAERFILCSENIGYGKFMTYCAESLGVNPPKYRIGKKMLGVGGFLLNIFSLLAIRGQMSANLLDTMSKTSVYNGNNFAKRFGFTYTPIKNIIDKCAKEYNNR